MMGLRWDSPHRRSSDRLRIRRWAVLLAGAMAAIIFLTGYTVARSATVTVAPDSLVPFAGIIRRDTTGPWVWVAGGPDSGHQLAGFTTLTCDSRTGVLHVRFPWRVEGGLKNVATAWVQHDETMARRGIIAGPSIAAGDMRILFTRITGTGPHPLSCASSLLRGRNANWWVGMLGQPS
jgi:hypothetical protein